MSSLGLGVLFRPGPNGAPYITLWHDTRLQCAGCGESIEHRAYVETAFHSLTVARVALHAQEPPPVEVACHQCELALNASHRIARAVYVPVGAFGALLLTEGVAGTDGVPTPQTWTAMPHAFFDDQAATRFVPPDDISVATVSLSEPSIHKALGRYFNAKQAVREWAPIAAQQHAGRQPTTDQAQTSELELGHGLRVVGADRPVAVLERALNAHDALDDVVVAKLVTNGDAASGWFGGPADWMPSQVPAHCYAVVSVDAVAISLSDVVARAPVTATVERQTERRPVERQAVEQQTVEQQTAAQSEAEHDGDTLDILYVITASERVAFDLRAIAHEAARTASYPGDIARLEFDRMILA